MQHEQVGFFCCDAGGTSPFILVLAFLDVVELRVLGPLLVKLSLVHQAKLSEVISIAENGDSHGEVLKACLSYDTADSAFDDDVHSVSDVSLIEDGLLRLAVLELRLSVDRQSILIRKTLEELQVFQHEVKNLGLPLESWYLLKFLTDQTQLDFAHSSHVWGFLASL